MAAQPRNAPVSWGTGVPFANRPPQHRRKSLISSAAPIDIDVLCIGNRPGYPPAMEFDWRMIGTSGPPVRLFYEAREVARLCRRMDGTWYVALNQHLPFTDPDRRDRRVPSYDEGKALLERWMVANESRIREDMRSWMAGRRKDQA